MASEYIIRPSRNLVYVRYTGFVTFQDSFDGFVAHFSHPDKKRGQNHLLDFTNITGVEDNYAHFMALQSEKTDMRQLLGDQVYLVLLAPTKVGLKLAHLIAKSWDGSDFVVPRVCENAVEALAILGQNETQIDHWLSASTNA